MKPKQWNKQKYKSCWTCQRLQRMKNTAGGKRFSLLCLLLKHICHLYFRLLVCCMRLTSQYISSLEFALWWLCIKTTICLIRSSIEVCVFWRNKRSVPFICLSCTPNYVHMNIVRLIDCSPDQQETIKIKQNN